MEDSSLPPASRSARDFKMRSTSIIQTILKLWILFAKVAVMECNTSGRPSLLLSSCFLISIGLNCVFFFSLFFALILRSYDNH